MTAPVIPLTEFDQEMAATRRLLERVPTGKGPWRPHPKSFPLGHLAQLVSWMPGWITRTLREPHIDVVEGAHYSFEPTEALVAGFVEHVRQAREALVEVTGARLEEPWSVKAGDRVLVSMARGPAARQHMSHLVHHRGQLTVYLRLLDVPLPSIYGPTADEKWG